MGKCADCCLTYIQENCVLDYCLLLNRSPSDDCVILPATCVISCLVSGIYAYHVGSIWRGIIVFGVILLSIFALYCICIVVLGPWNTKQPHRRLDFDPYEVNRRSRAGRWTVGRGRVGGVGTYDVYVTESSLVGYSASPLFPNSRGSAVTDLMAPYSLIGQDFRITMVTSATAVNRSDSGNGAVQQVQSSGLGENVGVNGGERKVEHAKDLEDPPPPKYEDLDLPPPYAP